jgi:hypothetical protein
MLSRTKTVASKRHLLAHGVWSPDQNGDWNVMIFKGAWPDELIELMPLNKRVSPEGQPVSLTDLKSTIDEVEGLISDFRRWLTTVTSQPPSPGTRSSQSSRKFQTRDQDASKRQRQPKPSAASRRKAALERREKPKS